MEITIGDLEIKQLIISSAEEAFSRNIDKKYPNPTRSRLFVSELANKIFNYYPPDLYSKNCVEIDKNNKGIGGEWLLDAFITKKKSFNEYNKYQIRYSGAWAIESEFKTGYRSFTKDFSKIGSTRNAKE